MEMNKDQQEFFDSFMDNFNLKYPPRYLAGVRKYKSTIHKDYSIEEHLENTEQELFDGLAYIHANKYLVSELRAENEKLKNRIESSLNWCEEDNGIRACKNCGLGEENE